MRMYSNMEIDRNKQEEGEERKEELPVEIVLVLQGGGSLGAYECGVYKTLAKHNIKFDIIAGTSIGALNASNNSELLLIVTIALKILQKNLKAFG